MKSSRVQPSTALLLSLVIGLTLLGTLFVFQASVPESLQLFGEPYAIFKQHLLGLLLGWIAFGVGLVIPAKWWKHLALPLIVAGVVGLLLVFIPGVGVELNGASRWISVAGLTVQPVEFFKFALVTYLAVWLPKQRGLLLFSGIVAIPAILMLLQPDLGSLLLLLAIAGGMYFLSGGSLKSLGVLVASMIPVLALAVYLAPYRMRRLTTFFDPESDPLGASFHIRQIILALGRGGWSGQGIGNSSQKYAFIPELSTDSIFAIVGEELGFIGSVLIIGLFIALSVTMYRMLQALRDQRELQLLGYGILIWISVQTLLNLGAVVALVPLTGIPLPFFSYGRSSLIMVLFATGVFLSLQKSLKET
ncbi:MAG: putative peptidoglycan glycosyltransferase FtsW [Patescibacteria group bacterium]